MLVCRICARAQQPNYDLHSAKLIGHIAGNCRLTHDHFLESNQWSGYVNGETAFLQSPDHVLKSEH